MAHKKLICMSEQQENKFKDCFHRGRLALHRVHQSKIAPKRCLLLRLGTYAALRCICVDKNDTIWDFCLKQSIKTIKQNRWHCCSQEKLFSRLIIYSFKTST